MAADAGELKARATLDNTEFLSSLKDLVQQVQSNTETAASGINKISDAFGKVGEAMAALGALKGLESFIGDLSDTAKAVGKLQASFEAINGVTQETHDLFAGLQELNLHSTFDLEGVLGPAAQNMLKLGVSAEDTGAAMQALADAAAAMKQGPQYINEVSDTLANMSAHVVVTQRDMKALQQEGIDGWGDLAKAIGTDVPTAMEEVKKGMITAQTLTEAVTDDLGTRFKGAADQATNSWGGAFAVLQHSTTDLKAAIGQDINAVLNDLAPIIKAIADQVQNLTEWVKNLSPGWKEFIGDAALAVTVIGGVAAAIGLVTIAAAPLAAVFSPVALAVGAAVAALALIGKWVYDNWPAIKAVFLTLWDDIVNAWNGVWQSITDAWNSFVGLFSGGEGPLSEVIDFLKLLFSPLIAVWQVQWDVLKAIFTTVVDWILPYFQAFVGGIKSAWDGLSNLFTNSALGQEITKLSGVWNDSQKAIAANNQALKDQKTAQDAARTAAADTAKQARQDEAQAVADANAKKQRDADAKAAAEQAKKDAAELAAYNQSLQKTYEALYAVAPDVAKEFDLAYEGVASAADTAAKTVGAAWDTLDGATQKLITNTLALGAAYKTLGFTGEAGLEGQAAKAAAAFDTLAASGNASSGELNKAFDSIVAKQQAVVDLMNTGLKDAYSNGKITAQDYYDSVAAAAQKHADEVAQQATDDETSQTNVAAAYQVAEAAKQAAIKNTTDQYNTAMSAVGAKTKEQLDAASDQWATYSKTISDKLGNESIPAIQANIKWVQSLIDAQTAMGKKPDDEVTGWLKSLQTQLENMKPPADQFADAMKKLGVNTTADAVTGINNLADALAAAKKVSDGSLQAQADLAAGQEKLTKDVQGYIDILNGGYKTALDQGKITQTEYLTDVKNSALEVLAQFTTMSTNTPQDLARITAATVAVDTAIKNLKDQTMKDAQKAFTDLGVQSHDAMQQMATDAEADFAKVAASANENGTTYMNAWINAQKKVNDALLSDGTSLSSAQKEDLAKMEAKRDEFLADQTSAWGTAYKTIHDNVGGLFDDMTKQIVTGDFSFGKLATKLWQDMADAALNAFIAPLKKAVTDFLSNELANLLGDNGLGGVLGKLTDIGKIAPGIFGSAAGAGGNIASDIGDSGSYVSDAGEAVSSASDAASSAGSTVASAVGSSVTGIIGAVGSVVSAISGIIGNFQMAHQTDILQSIEHNTRYTMMYVGDRADGGILGILFKIDEEIAWGANTKATENHRDLFNSWSGPALAAMNGIYDQITNNLCPYLPDIKARLEDILAVVTQAVTTATASKASAAERGAQITINAGNLTTAEAARALGNQIAANLTAQMVAIK
jgi:hypothetical protein